MRAFEFLRLGLVTLSAFFLAMVVEIDALGAPATVTSEQDASEVVKSTGEQEGSSSKKSKPKEPRLGNIAGTTSGNEAEFVDTDLGAGLNIISGSVSQKGPRTWVMKVFNNDDKRSYSGSIEIVQLDGKGAKIRRDSYSYSIRPKGTYEREISVGTNVKNCQLNLLSAKTHG